jgi:hypothetical protein
VGLKLTQPEYAQRVLSPYASGLGVPVGRVRGSTAAAFRRNPRSFARFIGDFRNAALNCS